MATVSTVPLATSDGSDRRRAPSTRTTMATRKRRPVLRTVARISSRSSPNERRLVAGRAASQTAVTAIPRATTSMRTWNDSARSARLFAKAAANASTTKTAAESTSAATSRDRAGAAAECVCMRILNGTIDVAQTTLPRRADGGPVAQITPAMTIASVVDRWPDAARIFARYGLSCASCAISKSETIMAGATGHGGGRVNMDELMRDLNTLADSGKLPDNLPAASATAAPGGMKMRGMAEQKGVKHVIAVMSGKGGVGKSLVAGLLAVGLKRRGFTVGVLDGDITGPSIPRMFGVREKPAVAADGKSLVPPRSRGGIPIMSMNLLLPDEGEAVIWRGPMVSGAIRQFFSDVEWGELDYLIVDLPPGTSDAPLTVMQALPVSGVVLVTTPQALAAMVVTKAVKLVKQLGGDILGIVENMSYVRMPDGSHNEVFGPSQGLKLVIASNAPLVAKIPLDSEIARLSDSGQTEMYDGAGAEELVE